MIGSHAIGWLRFAINIEDALLVLGKTPGRVQVLRASVFLLTLLYSTGLISAPLTTNQKREIDVTVIRILNAAEVPSASIAIVTDGKLDYARAYGDQLLDGTPATVTARYPMASISKQFTAAALLLLAEDGKVSLDDKVNKYLPTFTDADKVTIRQLLSHTSGYRDYWPQDYRFEAMTKPTTPQAILDQWAKVPLDFTPGSKWQYSNTGYVAAGLIAEMVAKEPLFAFEQRRIFKPLGMDVVQSAHGLASSDPRGSFRYAIGPIHPIGPEEAGWDFAAADLAMAPSELAKWNIARLTRAVLKPDSWQQQETNVAPADDNRKYGYGLGVGIDQVGQHPRIRHDGGFTGYLSANRIYPADRAAISVAINAGFSNSQDAIADAIEAMLFQQTDDTATVRGLYRMLRDGNVDRRRFTDNGNFYFSATALADFSASLGPLGDPKAVARSELQTLRGGLTVEQFVFSFTDRKLLATLRADPASGRVEQFTLEPYTD